VSAGAGSFSLAAATLWRRECLRFARQRNRVVGAIGTPLVFWLLVGGGLSGSFRHPAGMEERTYLAYLLPGVALLVVLFTSIFSTFSLIEDRQEGFLQGVLVAPVSRGAIVLGKTLGGTTLAVLQGALVLALAAPAGIDLSWRSYLSAVGVLAIASFGLTGVGVAIAWRMDSIQGFHAIMNLFLMPMWFLSGALFPPEGAAAPIRLAMAANPLAYALGALRASLEGRGSVALPLAVTVGFAAGSYALASASASQAGSKAA
jgi:ABC-2 type transport system permease protein